MMTWIRNINNKNSVLLQGKQAKTSSTRSKKTTIGIAILTLAVLVLTSATASVLLTSMTTTMILEPVYACRDADGEDHRGVCALGRPRVIGNDWFGLGNTERSGDCSGSSTTAAVSNPGVDKDGTLSVTTDGSAGEDDSGERQSGGIAIQDEEDPTYKPSSCRNPRHHHPDIPYVHCRGNHCHIAPYGSPPHRGGTSHGANPSGTCVLQCTFPRNSGGPTCWGLCWGGSGGGSRPILDPVYDPTVELKGPKDMEETNDEFAITNNPSQSSESDTFETNSDINTRYNGITADTIGLEYTGDNDKEDKTKQNTLLTEAERGSDPDSGIKPPQSTTVLEESDDDNDDNNNDIVFKSKGTSLSQAYEEDDERDKDEDNSEENQVEKEEEADDSNDHEEDTSSNNKSSENEHTRDDEKKDQKDQNNDNKDGEEDNGSSSSEQEDDTINHDLDGDEEQGGGKE